MSAAFVKGQNGPVGTDVVVVSARVNAPVTVAALLVTEQGRVRSDGDLVCEYQPFAPGVRLQGATITITLSQVPAEIAQVRTVIALAGPTGGFGRIAPPSVLVAGADGTALYDFRIDGLSTESAVLAVEFYRRQGAWKVRALGAGYAGGFGALVSDHGGRLIEAPRPAVPQHPAATPGLPRHRPVSLAKGQQVTLRKDGGAALTFVRMGLGWDPVMRGRLFGRRPIEIDLDASVAMFAEHTLVDLVCFGQLTSRDGAIRHQGDNLTGEGDGDDEVILVDLVRVPVHVTTLLFFVTSYQGHTFEQVTNAFCRLVDNTTDRELARYALTGGMPYTAIAMAKVSRSGREWTMRAIGEPFQARTPGDAIPQLGQFLLR